MACAVHTLQALPKSAAVTVNGVKIPRDDISRETQHHPASKPVTAWQSAARALVIRELLLQRARLVGIVPAPIRDSAGRYETEEEALIRGLIEQEVATPEPDEETCRRYYDRNRRLFRSQPIYEAAHILFAACKNDAEGYERARRDAESVLAELKAQPERFGDSGADLLRLPIGCPGRKSRSSHSWTDDTRIRASAYDAHARGRSARRRLRRDTEFTLFASTARSMGSSCPSSTWPTASQTT